MEDFKLLRLGRKTQKLIIVKFNEKFCLKKKIAKNRRYFKN